MYLECEWHLPKDQKLGQNKKGNSFNLPSIHIPFLLKMTVMCVVVLGWGQSCYLEDAQGTNVPTCCAFHEQLQAQGKSLVSPETTIKRDMVLKGTVKKAFVMVSHMAS